MIPGIEIRNTNRDVVKVDTSSPAVYRRSVYLQQRRSGPATALATFDLPNMDPNCERRDVTTVAPQSLFLLNDEFVIERAKDLAARVIKEHPDDEAAQVRAAWRLTQAREPSAKELADFNRLLADQREPESAWLDAIEAQMAEHGSALMTGRSRLVEALAVRLSRAAGVPPREVLIDEYGQRR